MMTQLKRIQYFGKNVSEETEEAADVLEHALFEESIFLYCMHIKARMFFYYCL